MKLLKGDIKIWSLENFGELDKKISVASVLFDNLDRCQEIREFSVEECKQVKEAKARMWQLKKNERGLQFSKVQNPVDP